MKQTVELTSSLTPDTAVAKDVSVVAEILDKTTDVTVLTSDLCRDVMMTAENLKNVDSQVMEEAQGTNNGPNR